MENNKNDKVFMIVLGFIMMVFILAIFKVGQKEITHEGKELLYSSSLLFLIYTFSFIFLLIGRKAWIKLVAYLFFMASGVRLYMVLFTNLNKVTWWNISFITFVTFNLFLTTILIEKIKER